MSKEFLAPDSSPRDSMKKPLAIRPDQAREVMNWLSTRGGLLVWKWQDAEHLTVTPYKVEDCHKIYELSTSLTIDRIQSPHDVVVDTIEECLRVPMENEHLRSGGGATILEPFQPGAFLRLDATRHETIICRHAGQVPLLEWLARDAAEKEISNANEQSAANASWNRMIQEEATGPPTDFSPLPTCTMIGKAYKFASGPDCERCGCRAFEVTIDVRDSEIAEGVGTGRFKSCLVCGHRSQMTVDSIPFQPGHN